MRTVVLLGTIPNVMLCALMFFLSRYDPDILLGYEIQMHSWGYLLQRAADRKSVV